MSDGMTDAYKMQDAAEKRSDAHARLLKTNPVYADLKERADKYIDQIEFYERQLNPVTVSMKTMLDEELGE